MYGDFPFGNPDGARADIGEINEMFITNTPYAVDFSVYPDVLLNKRVIVGAKGSGKTVYLRKIQSILKNREENQHTGIYVDDSIDQNLNCTEKIIKVCDFYNGRILSEKWTRLWKLALQITLALKYLHDCRLKGYTNDGEQEELEAILKNNNLYFKYSISTYVIFQVMLEYINSKNDVDILIAQTRWIGLEQTLIRILRKSPAIYIFLDAIDIEYEHAPMHWTICQKGLFYAVMDMLQDKTWGERFHVIIALRNNVFSSVLRSEHATKFSKESHIFFLNWTADNIRHFIREKISRLNDCYFILQDEMKSNGKTIKNWLGTSKIWNVKRNVEEDLIEYITRHSRLVPRDIVIMCNRISAARRLYRTNNNIDIQEFIRKVIADCSVEFGNELITICAKNINAIGLPVNAGRHEFSEGFVAYEPYLKKSFSKLKGILEKLSSDRIDMEELDAIRKKADDTFEFSSYLSDILWQNGAIGYIDDAGISRLYAQGAIVDQSIPKRNCYTIRSFLIDALEIKNVYKNPEKLL